MIRTARRLVLALAPLALAACAPGFDGGYGDLYGGGYGYPGGVYSGGAYPGGPYAGAILDRGYRTGVYPGAWGGQQPVFRSRAERDAYLRGVAAAQRQQYRGYDLQRQERRYEAAERDRRRAERAVAQAERERRRAEWRDRRPVGATPADRADADRRVAELEARRARAGQRQAVSMAEREQARLARVSQMSAAQDRMDRIDRVQARQEARQRLAQTRSTDDEEIRRLLPYRNPGEQIGAFRNRVDRARRDSERESIPLDQLLRTRPQR